MTPFAKAAAAAVLTYIAILPAAMQSAAAVRKLAPAHAERGADEQVAPTEAAVIDAPGSIPDSLFEAALAAVDDDIPPVDAPPPAPQVPVTALTGTPPIPAPVPGRKPLFLTDPEVAEASLAALTQARSVRAPIPKRKPRTVAMVLADRLRAAEAEGRRLDAAQTRCLAENIYREARNQPVHGRYAIAEVTLNRVASGIHPATICGVVHEPSQFTWTSDRGRPPIDEMPQWEDAVDLAVRAQTTGLPRVVPGALNYYDPNRAKSKVPRWVKRMQLVIVIKDHRFYKPKLGSAA